MKKLQNVTNQMSFIFYTAFENLNSKFKKNNQNKNHILFNNSPSI